MHILHPCVDAVRYVKLLDADGSFVRSLYGFKIEFCRGVHINFSNIVLLYIYLPNFVLFEGCPSKLWTLQIHQKPNVSE